nr:zinc finger, CCHC-type, retrotransposon Gag domain protein [Tanacetum cinerariifolium]
TLLPQIHEEFREEFRTGSGSSNAGGNPPPVTIYTWLKRFNKQKPYSFEKATTPTNTETSTEFMQRFFRLAGFLGAAAGTEEEQAKNFQWGLRRSTLNHLMCMSYTDVAQVANAARNYEILHERDDDDVERPDKRQKSDRRGGSDNHRSSNNNYSGSNNRNSSNGRDQRNRGHQSNRSANLGSQHSRGSSEGYSYPVCTTCGRRHLGECRRAA